MKVSELTDALLDYWVAKAEGLGLRDDMPPRLEGCWNRHLCDYELYSPSTDWSYGGPIMQREKISVEWTGQEWSADRFSEVPAQYGETILIAAMRYYVAAKYGSEVPDE